MSTKYLHTIADENPDLQKQLGCMTGLFQIFNRQHLATGRRISSHNRKKLPSGESGKLVKEPINPMQKATEKKLEGVKERGRTSVESSTSSFSSSSCSSTFSSITSNKLVQPDPSVLGQSRLSKTPSPIVPKKQPDLSHSSQNSPDIHNIVKDSIQREKCELSVKTKGKNRVMKHIDSPRPQQIFKPVNQKVSAPEKSSRAVHTKERNPGLPPKDSPRFSYDERDSRDKWKSVTKLRELPRFSLDSKTLNRRGSSEPRSNTLLEDLQQRKDQRLTGVIAKLMGLEDFPDPSDENKHNQVSDSPKLTPRDNLSPKLKHINSPEKTNPRFPLEPVAEIQLKPKTLYPSVYGQIEKRLTELEFKKSGNDLRALKQILGAMKKSQENIDDKKDDSSFKLNNSPETDITPTIKGSDSPKKIEASIGKVVRKPKSSPVSLEGLPSLHRLKTRKKADDKKELISRKNQFRESSQQSLCPTVKRSYTSKQRSVSPRMQNNKPELDKQSHRITYTSEASTPRRAMDRQFEETFSSNGKYKQKLHVRRRSDDDHLSQISNISTVSQNDDVTSNYRYEVAASLDELRSKSIEQPSPVSVLDTTFYVEELPSPVKKILSAFTDEDDLSSDEAQSKPVDLVNTLNESRANLVLNFEEEKLENIKHLNDELEKVVSRDKADADSIADTCKSTDPMCRYVFEILSVSGLLKDLGTNSTFTQLHALERFINPHLFDILEQSKINNEVEDDEQSNEKVNKLHFQEKTTRKLIFDTTDEILVHILISAGFSDPWISPNKPGRRSFNGKKLLEKICSEMNNLQSDPEYGTPYEDEDIYSEISGVVLDIERLIFKDLISEIVSGEAGLPNRLNKSRRQLFTN